MLSAFSALLTCFSWQWLAMDNLIFLALHFVIAKRKSRLPVDYTWTLTDEHFSIRKFCCGYVSVKASKRKFCVNAMHTYSSQAQLPSIIEPVQKLRIIEVQRPQRSTRLGRYWLRS